MSSERRGLQVWQWVVVAIVVVLAAIYIATQLLTTE